MHVRAVGHLTGEECGLLDRSVRRLTRPVRESLQRNGFTVLAFDYRRLGESAGQPRLVITAPGRRVLWRGPGPVAAR
jgi:predicted alpha/beta hydrolase